LQGTFPRKRPSVHAIIQLLKKLCRSRDDQACTHWICLRVDVFTRTLNY